MFRQLATCLSLLLLAAPSSVAMNDQRQLQRPTLDGTIQLSQGIDYLDAKFTDARAAGDMYLTKQAGGLFVAINISSKAIVKEYRFPGLDQPAVQCVPSSEGYVVFKTSDTQVLGFDPSGAFLWSKSFIDTVFSFASEANYRVSPKSKIYFYSEDEFVSLDMRTGNLTKFSPVFFNSGFLVGTDDQICVTQQQPFPIGTQLSNLVVYNFVTETVLFNATDNIGGNCHGTDGTYWYMTNNSFATGTNTLLLYSVASPRTIAHRLPYYSNVGGLTTTMPALSKDGQLLTILNGLATIRLDVLNLTSGVIMKQIDCYTSNVPDGSQVAHVPGAMVIWDQNFTVFDYPGGDQRLSIGADNYYDEPFLVLGSSGLVLRAISFDQVHVRSIATGNLTWSKVFQAGKDGFPNALMTGIHRWVVTNNATVEVYKF